MWQTLDREVSKFVNWFMLKLTNYYYKLLDENNKKSEAMFWLIHIAWASVSKLSIITELARAEREKK